MGRRKRGGGGCPVAEVGGPLYGGMAVAWKLGMRLCHCMPCHAMARQGSTVNLRGEEGWRHESSSCLDEDGLGQRTQERQERHSLAQGDIEGQRLAGGWSRVDVVGTGSPVPGPIFAPQIERHGGSLESEHRIRGSGTLHMIVHGEGASAPAPSSGCSARNMEILCSPSSNPLPCHELCDSSGLIFCL